jgi:putative tryptophan/tyrosine transport system substrate-binding protein
MQPRVGTDSAADSGGAWINRVPGVRAPAKIVPFLQKHIPEIPRLLSENAWSKARRAGRTKRNLMRRNAFFFTSCAMLFAFCSFFALYATVWAQQLKIPRIGYVSGTGSPADPGPYVEALRQGLRDLGYVDGKNIAIEYRGAEGKPERYASLVNELIQRKVDVIVVPTLPAILAARTATKTIPIVMVANIDPVAAGLVDSLARPGGNITGLSTLAQDLSGKRLELLKEVVPRLSRVGVLRDADSQNSAIAFKEYEATAQALKVQLRSLGLRGPNLDLEGAFQAASKERMDAIITITNSNLFIQQKRIADLAIRNRLPSMYQGSTWVESGGLMSYSTNDIDAFRRAAIYVEKILKGIKPNDLPLEQPTKFELVINLKTAKQIGLTIPQSVLYRADKVIK